MTPHMTPQQAFEVMGLGQNATKADLKAAYRRLASKCHPDLNPHNPHATAQFQRLSAANDVLKKLLPESAAPEAAPHKTPHSPAHAAYAWHTKPQKGSCVDVRC